MNKIDWRAVGVAVMAIVGCALGAATIILTSIDPDFIL
jgi:hypothetical protein